MRYTLDPNGLMETMTTFGGDTVYYGYDHSLRLSSQTDPKDEDREVTHEHDARGRRVSTTFGSTATRETEFDPAGRVSRLTLYNSNGTDPTVLQSFAYSYGIDAAGTIDGAAYRAGKVAGVEEATAGLATSNISYGYNYLGRLTSAARTGTSLYTQSYSYDDNTNRLSATRQGTTTTATYDDANQMTAEGGTSHTYDRGGNLKTYSTNTITLDAQNKWTSGSINGSSVSF